MNTNVIKAVAGVAVAAAAIFGLSAACGDDAPASRLAKDVGPSTVPSTDTDLSSIVLGWGQQLDPAEITHPTAKDLTVDCTGTENQLRVKVTSPQGWKVLLAYGSQIMRVENSGRNLSADLDTGKIPSETKQIDWSTPNQVDLAAHATVPWASPYGPGQQFYFSAHIDCAP